MRRSLIVVIIFLLASAMGCSYPSNASEKYELKNVLPIQREISQEEERGFEFLKEKMMDGNNVFFAALVKGSPNAFSLSESMGQAMEYAVLRGDQAYFKAVEQAANKLFFRSEGYYAWKVERPELKPVMVSALVDDLRIFKAYYLADKNKLGDYSDVLRSLSKDVYSFGVNDGYLCDYYDGESKTKSNKVPLFYLDVQALNMLCQVNEKKWGRPMERAYEILLQMPEHSLGFYPGFYKFKDKRYVWGEKINMVENLYTAINLYHAGGDIAPFIEFLKKEIKANQCIYNWYDLAGNSSDRNESAAVYALAARLFAMYGDMEAAELCYRKVTYFQIGVDNPLEGGFGDKGTQTVYAFDQLEALLMMRMVAKVQ